MTEREVDVRACAKINLGLRVLYKRPDSFHELRTVFQTISIADELKIVWKPGPPVSVRIEGAPHIPENLVGKAARLVLDATGLTGTVDLRLKKVIPAGAGLGGGSSDAAAVLLALPVLTGHILPGSVIEQLALQLGSDVPFFLHGGTALGLGRGEELYPLQDRREEHGLLIAPAIHSSTAEAYGALSRNLTSNSLQNKLVGFQQEVWQGRVAEDGNDFEPVVFERHPELRRIKDRLLGIGARVASMSGSGSSIFGFFATPEEVEKGRAALQDSFSCPCTFFPFHLVGREEYQTAWKNALQPHLQGNEWPPRSLYAQ